MPGLKVAFHLLHFTERGTSSAVYDYAEGNEKVLGNRSLIIHPFTHPSSHPQVELRFRRRFPCRAYRQPQEIEEILAEEGAEAVYTLASGAPEPLSAPSRLLPNLVHAVFTPVPHGQRYAVISPLLSLGGALPVVPHIVPPLPSPDPPDLRQLLSIPPGDLVLGRHGGWDTFNAPGVEKAIQRHLREEDEASGASASRSGVVDPLSASRSGVVDPLSASRSGEERKTWLLLMNTRPLSFRHPRILYREATGEREIVSAFVNACDAMLHARLDGETFGLAAAEFSLAGKPVLTFPSPTGQNHHLEALGEKALIWRNEEELFLLLGQLPSILTQRDPDYWISFRDFSQESVMKKFEEVFLFGL